jgi:hypothetical protein
MRDPRRYGWRTSMILAETARDVEVQNSEQYRIALCRLMEAKDFLTNVFSVRKSLDRYTKEATRAQVEAEMEEVRRDIRSAFGTPFGSIFSSDTQSSLFGLRVYVSAPPGAVCRGILRSRPRHKTHLYRSFNSPRNVRAYIPRSPSQRWTDLYTSNLMSLLSADLDAYLSPRSTTKVLSHDVRITL